MPSLSSLEPLPLFDEFVAIYTDREQWKAEMSLPLSERASQLGMRALHKSVEDADDRIANLITVPGVIIRAVDAEVAALEHGSDSSVTDSVLLAARDCLRVSGIEIAQAEPDPTDIDRRDWAQDEVLTRRKHLNIAVDSQYQIAIEGQPISLNRSMKHVGDGTNEAEGRRLRVKVLKFLADHPDQSFMRHEIWAAIMGETGFSKDFWDRQFVPFLQDPPQHEGEPLIAIAKLGKGYFRYSLGPFEIDFEDSETLLLSPDERLFTLPNGGREITGTTMGRFATVLAMMPPEDPMLGIDLIVQGMYVEERLRQNGQTPDQKLSTLIAAFTSQYLKNSDSGVRVAKAKKLPDGITGKGRTGYYLEGPDEFLAPYRNNRPSLTLSNHEGAVLATFLSIIGPTLRQDGLPVIPEETLEDFRLLNHAKDSGSARRNGELLKLRERILDKVTGMLGSQARLELYLEQLRDRPGAAAQRSLILYAQSLLQEVPAKELKERMRAERRKRVTFDKKAGTIDIHTTEL